MDGKFKEQLAGLVRKFSKITDTEAQSQVKKEILQHPYLMEDAWQAAAHRLAQERYEKCRSLLESLRHRLQAGASALSKTDPVVFSKSDPGILN